ncbi:acyl-CoA synthetase [Nocardioides fonticola]|uniref:Acyl-CoA synthetase n=1 Tax=Nocardioides fonticola TaxID=450363 RepID=A0ABP7XH65_9ACTN
MYPGTTAATAPDRIAARIAGTDDVLTYGDLEDRANRLARAWFEAGLRRGDVVALLTTNDLRAFEVYWAAMRSGLYITAVNRHLTASEIAYIVGDCGAKVLVVAGRLAEIATELVPLTPSVQIRLAFGADVPGHLRYETFRDEAEATPLPDRPRGADMLYSSGTTGRPKGIKPPLPTAQVEEHAESLIHLAKAAWGMGEDTVYLSPAPLYHAAPLRTAAAVQALGGTVVVMQRFEAEAALEAIETHRITHSQWVPTMFVRLLKLEDDVRARYDVSSMRMAIHAAAPCPPQVKHRMIEWWGPVITEYYASTEANGLTLISAPEWLAHEGSVGRAVIGRIRICDGNGAEVPVGTVGTVYFERDELPFTYHGDPEKTRSAQHPDHPTWTTTGDLGRVDEEGYLYLADRQSFLIISGGVNIYPQEIENCLALHPAVDDVAVTGVPDEEMGESVHAWIVPSPGHAPADEEARAALAEQITTHVRAHLAGYKVPRGVTFVDTLPRTPTGKLVKARIAAPVTA